MIGRLNSGIIGLGMLLVRGWMRVPKPPAMMTAFIKNLLGIRLQSGGLALGLLGQHPLDLFLQFGQVAGFDHVAVGQPG